MLCCCCCCCYYWVFFTHKPSTGTFIIAWPCKKPRFCTISTLVTTNPTFYPINSHFWVTMITVLNFTYPIKVITFERPCVFDTLTQMTRTQIALISGNCDHTKWSFKLLLLLNPISGTLGNTFLCLSFDMPLQRVFKMFPLYC